MTKDCYKIITQNRRARYEYFIEDEYEAGIVLLGSEIKSIRSGKVNINDAYIEFDKNRELYLVNSNIAQYKLSTVFNHEPTRKRKLLLKRREIDKIIDKLKIKGLTCIPLILYISSKNLAKIKIATAKGKKLYDKREVIKERDFKREKALLMKEKNY